MYLVLCPLKAQNWNVINSDLVPLPLECQSQLHSFLDVFSCVWHQSFIMVPRVAEDNGYLGVFPTPKLPRANDEYRIVAVTGACPVHKNVLVCHEGYPWQNYVAKGFVPAIGLQQLLQFKFELFLTSVESRFFNGQYIVLESFNDSLLEVKWLFKPASAKIGKI